MDEQPMDEQLLVDIKRAGCKSAKAHGLAQKLTVVLRTISDDFFTSNATASRNSDGLFDSVDDVKASVPPTRTFYFTVYSAHFSAAVVEVVTVFIDQRPIDCDLRESRREDMHLVMQEVSRLKRKTKENIKKVLGSYGNQALNAFFFNADGSIKVEAMLAVQQCHRNASNLVKSSFEPLVRSTNSKQLSEEQVGGQTFGGSGSESEGDKVSLLTRSGLAAEEPHQDEFPSAAEEPQQDEFPFGALVCASASAANSSAAASGIGVVGSGSDKCSAAAEETEFEAILEAVCAGGPDDEDVVGIFFADPSSSFCKACTEFIKGHDAVVCGESLNNVGVWAQMRTAFRASTPR